MQTKPTGRSLAQFGRDFGDLRHGTPSDAKGQWGASLGGLCCAVALMCALCTTNTAVGGQQDNRLADFSKIRNLVRWHFSLRRDHSPGDILSRSNVEPVLKQLRLIGSAIPDQKSILNRVPRDDDYLVRQLRSTVGRKFMHNVREYPMVYDRMDRLTGMANGRKVLQEMIKSPEGHKVMLVLTQKNDGKEADPLLARLHRGPNFDKPTGRIYTVDNLLVALQKSYDKSIDKAASSAAE